MSRRSLVPSAATVLVALFLLVVSTAVPAQQSLRLVSTAWPPFTNPAGEPRFALDLVEAALARMGRRAETTFVEPKRYTTSLLSGEFDGSPAAWKDAERERVFLFSQPYLENRLLLVGRRGADVSANALGALSGKRVAIVEGYSYGDAIDLSGALLVRSRDEEDSLRLLLSGKADYTLMDELVVQYILNNHPNEARTRLSLGTNALLTRPLYFVTRRARPDADAIITAFNAQLRSMIVDRTYHRLLHVAWITADVDGDGVAEFVPASDAAGKVEPQRAYALFTETPEPKTSKSSSKPGFYVGGNIYTDWASVPNRYKVDNPQRPDASRSTASIFRFTW
jgi:polar amino acid transport system substrate-binding protein